MLPIILFIFKLIGFILLVILGLLLLILLTVLLIPVRYHVAIEHGDKFHMEGGAAWLLHFVNAGFSYIEGKLHIKIKIMWFTLFDNLNPKKQKSKKNMRRPNGKKISSGKKRSSKKKKAPIIKQREGSAQKVKPTPNITAGSEISNEGKSAEEAKLRLKEATFKQKEIIRTSKEINEKSEHYFGESNNTDVTFQSTGENNGEDEGPEDTVKKQEKKSVFYRIYFKIINLKDRIIAFFTGLKDKIREWYDNAVNMKQKIRLLSDFIKNEYNKEGFQITFNSLKKLIKHILPTKLESRIEFGTGDPCSTGQALGAMGFLYSFYGDKIEIVPDFVNKKFEGKHYAKGRIRLLTILIIVIRLILDKRFKTLKNNFQLLKEAL